MIDTLLPTSFRQQMQQQLGVDYPAFQTALQQPPPVSVRVNPQKKILLTNTLQSVPWCAEGFYLPERPVFTLDPLFQAGAFYVQEASSMLLAEALRQTVRLQRPLRVLDLCAAPGGKSTLLASLLSSDSLLVCNEVIRSRVPVLKENLEKWGFPNVAISNHDPEDFRNLNGFFDVVLVDAPCSGEGLFRKDPEAMQEWSEENVRICAARQQRILTAAAPLLCDNGLLFYSTCTYNDAENVQNAQWLTANGFENVTLDLPVSWGIVDKVVDKTVGYQCYPHRVRGEGFFLSIFKKKQRSGTVMAVPRGFRSLKPVPNRQEKVLQSFLKQPGDFSFYVKPNGDIFALPEALSADLRILDTALFNKGFGLEMGTFKGNDFIPSHALALSTAIAENLPAVDLSKEDAIRYFKKENLVLADSVKGWLLARYEGLNLGWLKGVGNRVNNYLPKEWRIRMDIKEY
ncbi:16S rRNA C967 or C1407 C5-methylase (RsmB/RsmF family) [Larkinella arboricola]|uniref:16S rRNA C967 or C1407 C5-methylase (RsmB/RsmF family) n=1 Tax=Larkinella arboricola TaxID=643671 RepID=A0A327WZT9_LARAB|nr:RNA methyltransferase [Larkinella arboricola]RAJ97875.1 16S rRNA C967 or C1407 C5-methylase (RsmB/RsmF family) [Larkinella arboricola]